MPKFQFLKRLRTGPKKGKMFYGSHRAEEIISNKNQICFSFSVDKVFHLPEFKGKLFLERIIVGGFLYLDSLLIAILSLVKHIKHESIKKTLFCQEPIIYPLLCLTYLFKFQMNVKICHHIPKCGGNTRLMGFSAFLQLVATHFFLTKVSSTQLWHKSIFSSTLCLFPWPLLLLLFRGL